MLLGDEQGGLSSEYILAASDYFNLVLMGTTDYS